MSDFRELTPAEQLVGKKPPEFDFDNPFMDPEELADDLWKNMKHFGGVGLSATQVGLDTKVFVMGTDDMRLNVFNPQVLTISDKLVYYKEGCLTWPFLFMQIKRPTFCIVSYYDENGEAKNIRFEGMTARIFMHEYDHMMGVDFTQRASKLVLERALKARDKKLKKLVQQGKLKLPNVA